MATFVLEIGSEELPSRFLAPEEAELRARFSAALDEAGLEYGAVRVMSTPRRAVALVEDLNPVQREKEEVISGPPARVAYGPLPCRDHVPAVRQAHALGRVCLGLCPAHPLDSGSA